MIELLSQNPSISGIIPIDSTMMAPHDEVQVVSPERVMSETNEDASKRSRRQSYSDGTQSFAVLPANSSRHQLLPQSKEYFTVLQKWEGYVVQVMPDTFLARLIPILGEGDDLDAELWMREIEEDDRLLVVPGAIFYWSIGYSHRPSGRQRTSVIRFQRLPVWTKIEIESARAEVGPIKELLNARHSASPSAP